MRVRRLYHVPSSDWTAGQIGTALRRQVVADAVSRFETAACELLGIEVVAFGSARSALAAILQVAPPPTRTVLVPAYTCVAVPNSVGTAGCSIRWIDVDGPNVDLAAAIQAASPGDALIAQHTYGVPLDRAGLTALVEQGVQVIEDRAHRFDAEDLVGAAAIFSMEHSKVASTGQGGLAWARDPSILAGLRDLRDGLRPVSDADARRVLWTSAIQLALDARPLPRAISSTLRRVARRLPLTSQPAQTAIELAGGAIDLRALHPAFATIGLESIRRVPENRLHRRSVAAVYRRMLGALVPSWAQADRAYVRQPVLVQDADVAARRLRAAGLDLGERWFNAPVHPAGSRSTYPPGSAPHAERLARTVLSLPTHPRIDPATAEAVAVEVLAAAG